MALSLLSTVHMNVNCTDLDRSLAFYRDLIGLRPATHTNPPPQDGTGFGLSGDVQWDAHILHDDRSGGPAIDLLEWQRPTPVGSPPARANEVGFARVCLSHPDLDELHGSFVAAGVHTWSAPADAEVAGAAMRFLCSFDPDGTCVEFIEMPGAVRLVHAGLNCTDLDRSAAWYREIMGLEGLFPAAEMELAGAAFGIDGRCRARTQVVGLPEVPDLFIDLVQWLDPAPSPRAHPVANQVGLFRMAWLVADAAAATAELDRLGVEHSGAVRLDMGPEVPIDGLNAVFFRDLDGACLELIEVPGS